MDILIHSITAMVFGLIAMMVFIFIAKAIIIDVFGN